QRAAAKPAQRAAAKPEPRAAAKPAQRAAAKPEPRAAAKPEPRAAAKPEPRAAAKPEPRTTAKPAPRPAAQPPQRPATTSAARPAAKPEPHPAAQPEPRTTVKPSRAVPAKPAPATAETDRMREEIQQLNAALERARADARAARDEVARLQAEGDALRSRLDTTEARPADAGAGDGATLESLRAELDREREAGQETRRRAEETARTWRRQVEEAHAEAARLAAAEHAARVEIDRLREELGRAKNMGTVVAPPLESSPVVMGDERIIVPGEPASQAIAPGPGENTDPLTHEASPEAASAPLEPGEPAPPEESAP
ncbi:MAG TPA: hypothetical protein VH877_11785, partial [Polyangia bacterium]|nr:hypothetical protein [Polyangia bacterium]